MIFFLFIRSTLFLFFITILSIFWCLLLYLSLAFTFKVRKYLFYIWSRLILISIKIFCGIKYKIKGLENIPKNKSIIFFSKHQSAWETFAFLSLLPNSCFILKKSLLNIPFFGWGMRLGRHIAIDRKLGIYSIKKILKLGEKRKLEGLSIIIFPEGTRTLPNEHPKFYTTGIVLAQKTKSKIIPIVLNSGKFWPKNKWIKFPGTILVLIGKSIDVVNLDRKVINKYLYKWIKNNSIKLEEIFSKFD